MSSDRGRDLDKALESGDSEDPQLAPLVELGRSIQSRWAASPPARPRERRMFVSALAGRRTTAAPALSRIVVPALALSALMLFLGLLAQTSLPGDVLWPVRRSLYQAGVFTSPEEAIGGHVARARNLLTSARAAAPGPARRLALRAVTELGAARSLLRHLEPSLRGATAARITALENRALTALTEEDRADEGDSSGPGSGDDSSGPGDSSGPSGDDSSGPGGGGDSDGPDDSSGPGSGGDSSGSGGGDDSSGSGGGGDSSGPGGG